MINPRDTPYLCESVTVMIIQAGVGAQLSSLPIFHREKDFSDFVPNTLGMPRA